MAHLLLSGLCTHSQKAFWMFYFCYHTVSIIMMSKLLFTVLFLFISACWFSKSEIKADTNKLSLRFSYWFMKRTCMVPSCMYPDMYAQNIIFWFTAIVLFSLHCSLQYLSLSDNWGSKFSHFVKTFYSLHRANCGQLSVVFSSPSLIPSLPSP